MDRPARFAPAGAGDRRGHRGASPIPHAVAGGCATQTNSSRTAKHDHALTRARALLRCWSHGSNPLAPKQPPPGAHPWARPVSVVAMPSSSTPPAERCHSGRALCLMSRTHAARHDPPPPPPPPPSVPSRSPLGRALQFGYPVWVWQAEEAVANLPLRLAVRVHCGQPSLEGYSRRTHSLHGHSRRTHSYITLTLRVYRHGTSRSEECAAVGRACLHLVLLRARARARLNDRGCTCRGSSCS